MKDCCCRGTEPDHSAEVRCPACGVVGKPVSITTLKHMVRPELLDAVDAPGFQFCRAADCNVVYFHENGASLRKADVRVRVGLKETEDPVPICYCFGFTEGTVRYEIESTGNSTIPERIAVEMKSEHCACEVRNPQGSCCLGNVRAAVKRLSEAGKHSLFPMKS